MSDTFNTFPLVQTVGADNQLETDLDLDKNYVDSAETMQWVMEHIVPTIPHVMAERQHLEEEWREIRRAGLLRFDSNRRYMGRSSTYVPLWAHALDTLVTQTVNGLFPSDDVVSVKSKLAEGGQDDQAQAVADYIQYEFDKIANLRLNIQPGIRTFWEYGVGVFKAWYAKELAPIRRREFRWGPGNKPVAFSVQDREGLRVSSRNPFFVYVWPMTVDDIDQATLVFETLSVSLEFIEQQVRAGRWRREDADAVIAGQVQPTDEFNVQQQMLEQVGSSASPSSYGGPLTAITTARRITECWVNVPLPASAYVGDEPPGYPVPCKVVLAGNRVLEIRRNPFFHQRAPYLFLRDRVESGSFYGKGNGYFAKQLQAHFNDLANQVNDNGTYALNPVALTNVSLLAGPLTPLRPGAVINVLGPGAVTFDRPPVEQLQYGMSLMSFWQSMLQDVSGAPPIMQGLNSGKGARTATSSQILQKNASQPLQHVITNTEAAVMRPLMRMAWLLGQQYRESDVFGRVAGRDIRVAPAQLVGDYDLDWLASTQVVNQQARAAQAGAFLQAMANPLVVQLLMQRGRAINPEPVLRRLWTDGMGFRNFEEIVVDAPPPMMGPPGAPPGAPPGEEGPQDGTAMQGEESAGDESEFNEVRQGADMMSSMMGGGEM